MSDPLTPEIICLACKAPIDPTDAFCRRCGAPTRGATGLSSRSPAGWWESPWFVLAMLFLVLGPLALPLLWRSRRFNLAWKIAISVIVMGVTVYVVWRVWFLFNRALAPLLELEKLQKL